MKKINSQDLLDKQEVLTEKEVLLLVYRATKGERLDWDNFEYKKLTQEQTDKDLSWLINQYKTPNGKERKNNPFGYREQEVLENFSRFLFTGLYDAGNINFSWFVPIYRVEAKDGSSFEYVVRGGKIEITG